MKKFLAMLLTIAMLGGVLAGCGGGTATTTPAPAETGTTETGTPEASAPVETVDLTVGYMSNYGSLWSVITADKLGYFAEEGINITLTGFDSGPNIIAAMESGSVNFGYIGDGAHKLCVQGNATIIGLSHISNGDAVIGGPNVKTLEDLKGKTVAYSSGTSSETILTNALNSVGLTMDDITAMDMDASAVVTAMLSGGVDACAIWSPEPDHPGRDGRRHQAGRERGLLRHQHLPGQLDRQARLPGRQPGRGRPLHAGPLQGHGLRRPGGAL